MSVCGKELRLNFVLIRTPTGILRRTTVRLNFRQGENDLRETNGACEAHQREVEIKSFPMMLVSGNERLWLHHGVL